ncbi:MAG: DUF4177 domain-containing protein [Flavobacteriaceae bacterium]
MYKPTFEYKIVAISTAHLKRSSFQIEMLEKFNQLGAEGWELVNSEGTPTEILYIFKRLIETTSL